ncbi:hypothetical protein Tsp_12167 [Trichinella spiralis]|uniref:hypothetical protein n=1 Tax=Trichinella spiralis TaxID=6334 RepID=UPI0001EFB684|nr:hypothetical protein Tsp_12167 [Trichinella spiralis]
MYMYYYKFLQEVKWRLFNKSASKLYMLVACLRKAFVEKMEKVIVNVQIRCVAKDDCNTMEKSTSDELSTAAVSAKIRHGNS